MARIRDFLVGFFANKKYKTVFIISVFVAAFIIAGAVAAKRYSHKDAPAVTAGKTPQPQVAEQLVTSPLDGMPYQKDLATRHPLAVSIENHPDTRPQSGLYNASIVYEAITEGGITRFLAIFGPKDSSKLEPIRSARLFFMDYIKEYDAFFAHDGGNEDALANMSNYKIKDLPPAAAYFHRDPSRAAPHNEYSSTAELYKYATSKGFDINTSSFETLKFRPAKPATTSGKSVEIDFSRNASFKVKWQYDSTDNSYKRFHASKEHIDKETGKQITAKNVIIQTVDRTLQPHGSYGDENWVFKNVGSGQAKIYRDGEAISANWKKTSRDSRTRYYDESATEIELTPGNTWYEIAASDTTTVNEI